VKKSHRNKLICERCKEPVKQKDSFCPNCGGLFSDDLFCVNQKSVHANGVCVICSKPLCDKCGSEIHKTFLCDKHSVLDIYEGKVRVFGNTDNMKAQLTTTFLKQAGFHPFFYPRNFNPAFNWSIVGVRGIPNQHVMGFYILVPFSEYLSAIKELKKHKLK